MRMRKLSGPAASGLEATTVPVQVGVALGSHICGSSRRARGHGHVASLYSWGAAVTGDQT